MSTTIDTTAASAASTAGSLGGSSDLLNQEVFMTMLIQQLQNQDPLNPMDTEEMTSQLAQLSSLQELQNVNDNFETLHQYQMALNNAQSVSLIGKRVKAVGDSIQLANGSADLSFYLGNEAAGATVTITDESGDIVRTIKLDNLGAGENNVTWDGTDNQGEPVADGTYEFSVEATNDAGESVGVDTFVEGIVESIHFEGGIPILVVNGKEVVQGDIYEISTTTTETSDG